MGASKSLSLSPPLFDDGGGGLFLFLSFKSVPLPLLLLRVALT